MYSLGRYSSTCHIFPEANGVHSVPVGFGTEFRSENIPRNRLGTVSVIPRKSQFRSSERNGTEWKSAEKISFGKQQQGKLTKWFVCTSKVVFSDTIIEKVGCRVLFSVGSLPRNGSERHSEILVLFFVAWKGFPNCDLFRGMVRKGIPRICISFGSTERNSDLCSLPQKGSEQNYGSLLRFVLTNKHDHSWPWWHERLARSLSYT